jgi:putative serine protease PepD
LAVGQTVVAVTATKGVHYRLGINVVSDRNLMVATGTGVDVAGLVQTGITVTPDMAGGALVDQNGTVVGILTRAVGASPNADVPDGLAVPASTVRDVLDQLDGSGKVAHGWMGVLCTTEAADRADGGAQIVRVVPDGPAEKAGLRDNDIVVRAGDEPVTNRADLVAAVRSLRTQDRLDVQYLRDSHAKTVTVTLGAGDPAVLAAWPDMG